jgi:hypothetical protein
MLATVPIGDWVSSLVFDVASWFVGGSEEALVTGARWLIAIGI